MIYEWKCKKCGHRVDVHRPISEYDRPPNSEEGRHPSEDGIVHDVQWVRVYSSSVPFEHLRNSGVFADDNGNFAPRKL